jgi:AraC-like DNA-binding protein
MLNYQVSKIRGAQDIIPLMVGRERCTAEMYYGPNVRDHYIVHFCFSGRGTVVKDDYKYEVREGELFIIRPGENVTYYPDKQDPWYYAWISFVGDRAGVFKCGATVRKSPNDIGIRLLDLVESGETSADIFCALIYELIYCLYSEGADPYDRIAEVRRYIRIKMKGNISASDIADMFNYERSYLHRLFKEKYGVTVKQYMTSVRMARAKRLLESGKSVVETAYEAGYCNEFNFSKAFKQFYVVSPSTLKPKNVNKKELD